MEGILKQKKYLITGGVILLAVVMVFLLSSIAHSDDLGTELTGKIEAKEVDINTKIPGRVQEIKVVQGQVVKAGDILAVIDDKDLRVNEAMALAGIAAAEGDIAKAKAGASLVDATAKAAVEKAQAGVAKAEADLGLAEKTYRRLQELFKEGFIAQQDLDKAEREYMAAQAGLQAAQGDLAAARAGLSQVDVYQADVQRAQAALAKAQADLQLIRNNLEECRITAPAGGTVTAVNVEEKELVAGGLAVMTVTDYAENWLNIKVPQTLLNALAEGQEIKVYLPGKEDQAITGTIEDISSKAEFATARATNDRGEKDIITYNVKIRLDAPDVRPGMNAYVRFE